MSQMEENVVDQKNPKVTIDEFKKYVRDSIDKYYWDTPSAIVLRSFYLMDVEKEVGVTLRSFDYLRAISEKESNIYKAILANRKK